jgi:hypothetical protein
MLEAQKKRRKVPRSCGSSRVFRSTAWLWVESCPQSSSHGISRSPEAKHQKVSPYSVKRNHFAVLPFPQLCGLPLLILNLESADIQVRTPTSFAFLQSLAQLILASSPQRSGSSPGLPFPSAQVRIEGPLVRQASTPTFVPPSGFGYPLDGFLPSTPSEFCFTLTALLGFTLRSFTSPQGSTVLPPQFTHLSFSPTLDTDTSANTAA